MLISVKPLTKDDNKDHEGQGGAHNQKSYGSQDHNETIHSRHINLASFSDEETDEEDDTCNNLSLKQLEAYNGNKTRQNGEQRGEAGTDPMVAAEDMIISETPGTKTFKT